MRKNWFVYLIICFCMGIILCVMATTYAEIMDESSGVALLCPPEISAEQAVLLDAKSGEVLLGKDHHRRAYPASTTKIMTALVALDICREQGVSLEQRVVVPKSAVGVEGSSIYLKAGEKITIRDLMYGMMLRSGNDAATAVAVTLGGTEENFVRRMNERAKNLGCENTNFLNPTGLFDENHYTTAYELGIISREAMKNEDFREIVGCKTWETSGSAESSDENASSGENASLGEDESPGGNASSGEDESPGGNASSVENESPDENASSGEESVYRVFNNKNKTIYQYEGATGIKIGYTQSSGRTLVASSKRGENQLVCVVLNDGNWFNDAYRLMDYGYEMLEKQGI